ASLAPRRPSTASVSREFVATVTVLAAKSRDMPHCTGTLLQNPATTSRLQTDLPRLQGKLRQACGTQINKARILAQRCRKAPQRTWTGPRIPELCRIVSLNCREVPRNCTGVTRIWLRLRAVTSQCTGTSVQSRCPLPQLTSHLPQRTASAA